MQMSLTLPFPVVFIHLDMTSSWVQHVVKSLTVDKWSNSMIEKVPTYRDFCSWKSVIEILNRKIENVHKQVLLDT